MAVQHPWCTHYRNTNAVPLVIPSRSTDHVERGLAKLTERWRNSATIKGWLTSYLRRVQEVEDLLWQIIDTRVLDNCVGTQLDLWGAFADYPRFTADDDIYRAALKGRLMALRSNGSIPDLIKIVQLVLGVDIAARVTQKMPKQVRFFIDDVVPLNLNILTTLLSDGAAAGVQVHVVSSPRELSQRFTYRYSANPSDPAKGYSYSASPSGGHYCNVETNHE